MRFHLLALANAQTTRAYSLDGFAMMTIRFATLLKSLGHTVLLYASEENEAPCDELITCITKEEIDVMLAATVGPSGSIDPTPYQYAYITEASPLFQLFNARAIREIAKRKEPKDFLCILGGLANKPVADAHADLMCVEYSIGYEGSFSPYRVFESQAWRHWTYGWQAMKETRMWDAVIPCFFDPAEFPFRATKEPFALYVGRLVPRKGVETACRAAHAAGVPLRVIGHGDPSLVTHGAEYLGALDLEDRNQWMARASAVFCPTTYIEPFNCVAVEAQFCGTPVLATDNGGMTETIEQGRTGFRCSYLGAFVEAIAKAHALDPTYIRSRAVNTYSIEAVKPDYQRYFERLMLLWDRGWDTVGDVYATSHPTQEGDVVLVN